MSPDEIATKVRGGHVRTAARLMRDLDDARPRALEVMRRLHAHTGHARVIGVTGNPGAGKSTLTDRLIRHYRARDLRVAVVAIDPTSPITGGAILGDRVRMQHHAGDPGVFIRSLATRGVLGGLSASTRDVIDVFDAMGFDVVIVETVGVGQDEVNVATTVETSVVVVVPGLGDGVQAIKAGLLEIADVFVVNKADHPDADRAVAHLATMLQLEGDVHGPKAADAWTIPILRTVSTRGEGVDALVAAIDAHRDHLATSPDGPRRARDRLRAGLTDRLYAALRARAERALDAQGGLDALIDEVETRRLDPQSAVEQLLASI